MPRSLWSLSQAPDGDARMFSRTDHLPHLAAQDGFTNVDAITGLQAIAAALDHGLVDADNSSSLLSDAAAIGLGWSVLIAVICYPTLQLVAIILCAIALVGRSLGRLVLGGARHDPVTFVR